MPRRALRKLDPALDLSAALVTLERLPRPWDDVALFGRVAPLEVEIGSGKGLFLATAAAARPERNFLGSEIAGKYARSIAGRLVRGGLSHARVLHGDSLRLFAEFLPDEHVAEVHVYFPDPWWKKRHRKRRVMRESLLADIERVLVPQGRLHFWTDVEEYYNVSLDVIAGATRLTGPRAVDERPAEHDLDYRTHFERRMRRSGLPVYRALYVKEHPWIPRATATMSDTTTTDTMMPTITLHGAVTAPRVCTPHELATIDATFQIPDVSTVEPNRQGTAVTLEGLLSLVELKSGATHVTLHATADDFHASVPLAAIRDRGMLLYRLHGQPLPPSAGGPFRFFIRDFTACHAAEVDECANVKFVDAIEFTIGPGQDNRPHDDASHTALHAKG